MRQAPFGSQFIPPLLRCSWRMSASKTTSIMTSSKAQTRRSNRGSPNTWVSPSQRRRRSTMLCLRWVGTRRRWSARSTKRYTNCSVSKRTGKAGCLRHPRASTWKSQDRSARHVERFVASLPSRRWLRFADSDSNGRVPGPRWQGLLPTTSRLGEDAAGGLSVWVCDSRGGVAVRSFCDRFLRVRLM